MNILSGIVGVVANIGTTKVVTDVVKTVLPQTTSKIGKFFNFVGILCIGGIVGDAAQQYAEGEVKKLTTMTAKLSGATVEEDEDAGEED